METFASILSLVVLIFMKNCVNSLFIASALLISC